MHICLGVLLSALACWGQTVTLGMVGGVRGTDDLGSVGLNGPTTVSKSYVVGPSVEIGLPHRFALDADALYRREGYQVYPNDINSTLFSSNRANSWEFPVLIKYRLGFTAMKPFVEGGYAPRVISTGSADTTVGSALHGEVPLDAAVAWPCSHGVVVGGGAEFHAWRLRIAPFIRYTRWSNTAFSTDLYFFSAVPSSYGPWHLARNQLDVLLNIGWKLR